jgi:hypothetical protein
MKEKELTNELVYKLKKEKIKAMHVWLIDPCQLTINH